VSQIRIRLDFSLELLVALKVIVSIWIFNVGDQGMLLAHLDVVVCKLILIMLILGALDLVFVGILGVLVEVGLTLAVDANLKYLAGVRVGTTGSDGVLDGLEGLVDCSEGIEVGALNTWLEGGLSLLGGGH
jgi:hypothetical protein